MSGVQMFCWSHYARLVRQCFQYSTEDLLTWCGFHSNVDKVEDLHSVHLIHHTWTGIIRVYGLGMYQRQVCYWWTVYAIENVYLLMVNLGIHMRTCYAVSAECPYVNPIVDVQNKTFYLWCSLCSGFVQMIHTTSDSEDSNLQVDCLRLCHCCKHLAVFICSTWPTVIYTIKTKSIYYTCKVPVVSVLLCWLMFSSLLLYRWCWCFSCVCAQRNCGCVCVCVLL